MENNILESKVIKWIILVIACLIILSFIFSLGIFVGARRANFAFEWADQYHTNFGGPQMKILGEITGAEFTESSGVFGQIVQISEDKQILTIKGQDNIEKNIIIGGETIIVCKKKNMKIKDLKIGTSVVIIGEPDGKGQIRGELIRLMMPPKNNIQPGNKPPC